MQTIPVALIGAFRLLVSPIQNELKLLKHR